jgi:hypothetical protein
VSSCCRPSDSSTLASLSTFHHLATLPLDTERIPQALPCVDWTDSIRSGWMVPLRPFHRSYPQRDRVHRSIW